MSDIGALILLPLGKTISAAGSLFPKARINRLMSVTHRIRREVAIRKMQISYVQKKFRTQSGNGERFSSAGVVMFCSMCKLKLRDQQLCALEQGTLELVQDPFALERVCCVFRLSWQQQHHRLFRSQRDEREERGVNPGKRADMEGNKPVIARDSAYPAKRVATPASRFTLPSRGSQFRHRTIHST